MPPSESGCRPSGKVWPWRVLAGTAILLAAILRLMYLALDCPLDLAPDEAHYWDWSRHLDWSYYSKGPLVAYLIRGSCLLFGDLSRWLTGSEMLAVRFPAVLCGSLLLVSLYVLTARIFRRESLALGVVLLGLTMPVMAAGASLMTIDAPYTCCWGWALVAGHQAVFRKPGWAWGAAGLLVGLGILAKYTMVLWVPSLGLFLLATPEYRRLLVRPGFWTMALLGAVCCLPIVIWNCQNGWVTLLHTGGHANLNSSGIRWLGPLNYLAVQFCLLLGFWFVVWAAAMIAHRPGKEPRGEVRYLWWMSVPVFVFFGLCGLKNGGGEPNWPVAAYLSGMVLAAAWFARQLQQPDLWRRRLAWGSLALACSLGLILTAAVHFPLALQPLLLRIAGPATEQRPLPLRRFDPTCRLRGWRTLAAEIDRVRAELRAEGIEPVLAGLGWTLPGEVGFYCQGQPTVHSVGLALGDRHSQYDLWRPNPLDDVDQFAGRTFIIVGGGLPPLAGVFDRVEAPRLVTHTENGQPIAQWLVTVGRGYRGFPWHEGAAKHY